MSALLELAARVKALTGADRELDALIWCELNGKKYAGHNPVLRGFGEEHPETQVQYTEPLKRRICVTGAYGVPHAMPWTASLDAAMTLVPEGMRLMLSEWDDEKHLRAKGAWQAVLSKPGCDSSFDAMKGFRCDHAATPAIALVASALRARNGEAG